MKIEIVKNYFGHRIKFDEVIIGNIVNCEFIQFSLFFALTKEEQKLVIAKVETEVNIVSIRTLIYLP